jgi:hypothetical protein
MCYYQRIADITYEDILNDDHVLGAIAASIGPGGFHFKTHSRIVVQFGQRQEGDLSGQRHVAILLEGR